MRRIGLVVVAVVIGLGSVACTKSVSKADFKKQLDDSGANAGGVIDTQCVVDNLEKQGFKFRDYNSPASGDDSAQLTKALTECSKLATPSVPSIPGG